MTNRGTQRGFTLLELLMVVIIIAILASIALPQYLRVAERSRAAEALTVLAAVRSSEIRYRGQDPAASYTQTMNSLDIDGPGANNTWTTPMWNYAVTGTGAGSNATATRVGFANKVINIDLDSGNTCAPGVGNIYGLNNAAC